MPFAGQELTRESGPNLSVLYTTRDLDVGKHSANSFTSSCFWSCRMVACWPPAECFAETSNYLSNEVGEDGAA